MASLAANMMKAIARRAPDRIAKADSAEAWETTANLRRQYVATSFDAMPARVKCASEEWTALKDKIKARDVTVDEVGWGTVRAIELYGLYCLGKILGSKSASGNP